MARIPGERFDIDFDDESIEQPRTSVTGFVGDVLERQINSDVAPPVFKSSRAATGFPEHKKRTGLSRFKQIRDGTENAPSVHPALSTTNPVIDVKSPSTRADKDDDWAGRQQVNTDKQQIDAENKKTLASMSAAEIEAEQQELFAGLSPALISKLLKRSNIDDEPTEMQSSSSPRSKPEDAQHGRPSHAERKVSFALPDNQDREAEPAFTAARHSINSSSSPLLVTRTNTSSSDVSELGLSRTSSNTSAGSPRSHSHERKVSFVLPDYIELARKASPTAVKHSIASPMNLAVDKTATMQQDQITELELTKTLSNSALKSPGQRPVDHRRKVSFVLPDSQLVPEDRRPSSAASHSISGSPGPSPRMPGESDPSAVSHLRLSDMPEESGHQHEGSIHFPKPPAAPELDPNGPNFLDDLHKKYFPSLAHDPSKLAWMTAATEAENAAYDPASANLDPKDIRFDFKGRIIPPSQSARIPTDVGLHHHGDAPSAAGYTIAELGILSRSAFPAQRGIAMQTAGRILFRLGKGEFGNENLLQAEGDVGEKGMLAKGLWEAVEENRIVETITGEANKDTGHQTSIALAQEAVWNWRKGGGRQRKAV